MTTETVVTGLGWMETGVRSVQSALKEILREANQEVLVCAYSVTGGADEILKELEICLKRGVILKTIINRFNYQPIGVQKYLLQLKKYPSYHLYTFNDPIEELHAKLIVVDRAVALVGSANLSLRGIKNNYELGIIVRNEEVITIAKCFDSLLTHKSTSQIN